MKLLVQLKNTREDNSWYSYNQYKFYSVYRDSSMTPYNLIIENLK